MKLICIVYCPDATKTSDPQQTTKRKDFPTNPKASYEVIYDQKEFWGDRGREGGVLTRVLP